MSSQTFADLGVSSAVLGALTKRGIKDPFPIQRLAVPDVLAGRDVLVKSPTGSGKTLAFGVPMVDLIEATDPRPSALVLAPTRELALQIVEDIRPLAHARALSVAAVYGGAGIDKQAKLASNAHIVVATPGRLEDLIDRGALSLSRARILVLDEADRMLDMGFRPAVDRIVSLTPRDRQTLFFSATLEGVVGKIASAYTHDARTHEHTVKPERWADVEPPLRGRHPRGQAGRPRARAAARGKPPPARVRAHQARRGPPGQAPAATTASRRSRCTATSRSPSGSAHSASSSRVAWTRWWPPTSPREASTSTTSPTSSTSMRPPDHDSYVHRLGRTGRAGRSGSATTFVMHDQARDMSRIKRSL